MANPGNDFTRCLLIAGLGNPGEEYSGTRHNMGFMVVDRLLAKLPKNFEAVHGCSSRYWRGTYAGRTLLLQKPETYMNLSGDAVSALMRREGIEPGEIAVVYDDMDLELGRIRIGIGHGESGHGGADFVLSGFNEKEQPVCDRVIEAAADALILMLRRGCTAAMNVYNSQDYSEEKPEAENDTKDI